jgi:uncharacterized SAM-binding protein YcdF (DUF218 family)
MDTVFFVLSKLAWMVLSPGNVFILALILGAALVVFKAYRAAKLILVPSALLAGLVLAYPVGDWVIQPLEKRFAKPAELPQQIDGIIVLGGGEDLKRSLSWNVAEVGLGGDRYLAAKKLADLYPDAPVIFSGGSGSLQLQNTSKESHLSYQLLTELDIAPDRIIQESESRNTYENFRNLQPILQPITRPGGRYILITSAFHMPRSVGIARQFNIDVIPYPVDYRSNSAEYRRMDFDLFDHLKSLEPGWREWIGLTVYYHTGKTSEWFPSPKNAMTGYNGQNTQD